MNGKKARQLRKMAARYAGAQPWEKYTQANIHTKMFPSDLLGQVVPVEVCTVELDSCQKLFYREMKRMYKLRLQGKEATMQI